MDKEKIESILAQEALRSPDVPGPAAPTTDCLAMPRLLDIGGGRRIPTSDERAHIESCGFCARLIHRERVARWTQKGPPMRIQRLLRPLKLAACLALGLCVGRLSSAQPRDFIDENSELMERAADLCYTETLRSAPPADDIESDQAPGQRIDELERQNKQLQEKLNNFANVLGELLVALNQQTDRSAAPSSRPAGR